MARTLHCHAEGRDDGWEAICLDLDIAVQGDSFEEVYRSLNEAIRLYLESLADLSEDDRARLLARKSPLSVRLKVLGSVVRTVLFGRTEDAQYADFTIPAAA